MIEVRLKRKEPVDKALRKLKRAMDKEGIINELKERRYFDNL